MKHEWRKHEKELYSTQKNPHLITVLTQKYIMIQGRGNPNNADFGNRVGALMSLAYPIKMTFKQQVKSGALQESDFPYNDFTVYPLEGQWSSTDWDATNKDAYTYTIMIRQPDFITEEMFESALQKAQAKRPNQLLQEVTFGLVEGGLSAQVFHAGSYDTEIASFHLIDAFVKAEGYTRIGHDHREIYFNDARKVEPNKLKTLLRYPVKKKD